MSENENNGTALPVEPRGSRWKSGLSLFVVVLLLGAVYATTTPEFAVWQAHYAVKSKSVSTFERAVDVDSVAQNLVKDMVSTPVSNALGGGAFGNWVASTFASLFQPDLEAAIKSEIRDSVAAGSLADDVQNSAGQSVGYSTNLDALSKQLGFDRYHYTGIDYFAREAVGSNWLLTLNFQDDKEHYIGVKVELARADGDWFWKIIRISNFSDVSVELLKIKTNEVKDSL